MALLAPVIEPVFRGLVVANAIAAATAPVAWPVYGTRTAAEAVWVVRSLI